MAIIERLSRTHLRTVNHARIHQLANKAIEALRTRGWAQRSLCNSAGEVCAQGAMLCALGVDPYEAMLMGVPNLPTAKASEFEVLDAKFSEAAGIYTIGFNDSFAMTIDSIIAVFQKIADTTAPVGAQNDHELEEDPVVHDRAIAEAARRARVQMQKRGRCTGTTIGQDGSVCAYGAVLAGMGALDALGSCRMLATDRMILKRLDDEFQEITGSDMIFFNDHVGRSDQEVVDVFTRIEAKYRPKPDQVALPASQSEATLAGGPSS
jgi:hypothetical protein